MGRNQCRQGRADEGRALHYHNAAETKRLRSVTPGREAVLRKDAAVGPVPRSAGPIDVFFLTYAYSHAPRTHAGVAVTRSGGEGFRAQRFTTLLFRSLITSFLSHGTLVLFLCYVAPPSNP